MDEADLAVDQALSFRMLVLQTRGQLALSEEGWNRALARVPETHTDRVVRLGAALQAQYDDWAETDGLNTETLARRLNQALRVAKEYYEQ